MPSLGSQLELTRCPHCLIDNPNLTSQASFQTTDFLGQGRRFWAVYACKRCGGAVTAYGYSDMHVQKTYPEVKSIDAILPEKVKAYLQQAIDCTFAPSGSVMLCASAVDEMLKVKGYTQGSLYTRIDKAAKEGILTPDMEKWAHQVRLEANDQRHADVHASLPTVADAKLAIEFTQTLAEFLFVLPAKVTRGIASSLPTSTKP